MSKRAEELAKQLYPDPKLEDYDDILVYRTDRDNASMGRINVVRVYEQAEKDLALTIADIYRIHVFLYAVKNNKQGAFTFQRLKDEQYQDVLEKFNKAKEDEQ